LVKIAHTLLALTAVLWPASFLALLVRHLPIGLMAVAGLLTLALVSIRYVKAVTRSALEAYYATESRTESC
jgi:hypothetical protein